MGLSRVTIAIALCPLSQNNYTTAVFFKLFGYDTLIILDLAAGTPTL